MPIQALKNIATQSIRIFGESVLYRSHINETETEIKAIFNESYSEFDAAGVQVSERTPNIWVLSQNVTDPDNRDTFVVYGVEYAINEIEPDGFGIYRLGLRLL